MKNRYFYCAATDNYIISKQNDSIIITNIDQTISYDTRISDGEVLRLLETKRWRELDKAEVVLIF